MSYTQWKKNLIKDANKYKTPIAVQFELTSRCNLDCKMCYVHHQQSNSYKNLELSTEQWKRIMDEAFDAGMMFATVTGGECLVRHDFKELYLHLWNKGVFITVLSNGTLINPDIVELFKAHKPEKVRISLYGSSEDGYRRVTGHAGLEKALSAVRMLREADIPVQVNVTASSYLASDYIDTLLMIQKEGIRPILSELQLIQKRDSEDSEHYLSPDQVVSLSVERTKIFGKLLPRTDLPDCKGPLLESDITGMTCNAGNSYAFITWEGKMLPCAVILLDVQPSLREMSFAEAWKKTVEVAASVVQPAECQGCAYLKACPKCVAMRANDLHCGHCNPDVCELTRRLVEVGAKKLNDPSEEDDPIHGD